MCADITSASNITNESEPIDPQIALSIATPAMIQHGLIDQRATTRLPAEGAAKETTPSFLVGLDPQLLHPRPIHPRLEMRRQSGDAHIQPDANRSRGPIPSFHRSQSLPVEGGSRVAHYISQLEQSKRQAELEHYHRDRIQYAHTQGRHLDYTGSSGPTAPIVIHTAPMTGQHQWNINESLDPNPIITRRSKSPNFDATLIATGAPVSTTNSSYSDILEPLNHHLDALDNYRHDLLSMYQEPKDLQNDIAGQGRQNWSAGDRRNSGQD
jgi:hypothetical protein